MNRTVIQYDSNTRILYLYKKRRCYELQYNDINAAKRQSDSTP
jgi:hypothetical protein